MNTLENRRILIVDDLPEIHQDFRKILSPAQSSEELSDMEEVLFGKTEKKTSVQFELDSAFQGEEALEKVCAALEAGKPYAMAFVDVRMPPGWDGVQTVRHIWEKDPQLQIVICTAYSDYSWDEMLAQLDMRDRLLILKKPFDAIEVSQLANSLTTKWQMTQQALMKMSDLEKAVRLGASELEETQAKLTNSVQHAGMAVIATNVLHNVGNVVNSINISTSVVEKTVRSSKLEGLSKIVNMLDDQGDELGALIARMEKGRLLQKYLSQLADTFKKEQQSLLEEVSQITKSVNHIKEIVSTQQSYASGSNGVERVRLNDLVEDALRMNAEAFTRHQVTVEKEFADIPLLPLDKHRVLLIIVNLVSNAKQAVSGIEDRPHMIFIRTAFIDRERVQIQVSDQGEGISPENLEKVFVHGFTTRKNGHGFGLHSCSIAAKEMGGTLTVHSEGKGKGATFTLEIPATGPGQQP